MVQQELERYSSDMLYFDEHRQDFLKQYPERWVAIYNHQVVATDKTLKRLVSQLEEKGVPAGRAFLEYVTDQEDLLIL